MSKHRFNRKSVSSIYRSCEWLLNTPYRKHYGLKLENNTRLVQRFTLQDIRYFKISLHNNDIIYIFETQIKLSSCGWYTRTTKDRLNKYIPEGYYISSKRGVWYLLNNNKEEPFFNGMMIENEQYKTHLPDFL